MPLLDRLQSNSTASPSCWCHRSAIVNRALPMANSRFLKVSALRVQYIGPGTEDGDAASVRADHCVPSASGLYYFEVEVISSGRNGYIGVGFSGPDVKLDRLPGWEPNSFGYHGDDGNAFHHSGKGSRYGPTFGTGDFIGIIFNQADRTIAYTKNGLYLGVAFRNVCEDRLFPTVGMRTPDEEIVANFGATPFKGDLDKIMASASYKLDQQIQHSQIPTNRLNRGVAEQIVFDYLCQQEYWATAEAAGPTLTCSATPISPKDLEDARLRKDVSQAILAADIDKAIALIDRAAPTMLLKQTGLCFRLRCQQFMEMIKARKPMEALLFGQTHLGPAVKTAAEQSHLQDALTLVAHVNPEECPSYQQLLGGGALQNLAREANACIIRHQGRSERSGLETLIRQAEVLRTELKVAQNPAATLVDFSKYLPIPHSPP